MRNLAYELSNGVIREFPISESEASVVVEELKEAGDVIRIWTLNEQGDKVWEWKQENKELLQRDWRHVVSLGSCGYILWEVFEVMGEVNKFEESYLKCPDGTWLYVTCFHFFTQRQLEGYIDDTRDSTVQVITI